MRTDQMASSIGHNLADRSSRTCMTRERLKSHQRLADRKARTTVDDDDGAACSLGVIKEADISFDQPVRLLRCLFGWD